nr:MAG TPA: hypothetical protein [Bacteriophage sp.]
MRYGEIHTAIFLSFWHIRLKYIYRRLYRNG